MCAYIGALDLPLCGASKISDILLRVAWAAKFAALVCERIYSCGSIKVWANESRTVYVAQVYKKYLEDTIIRTQFVNQNDIFLLFVLSPLKKK